MPDTMTLAIDPSSPDAEVEDRFFQQGLNQETSPRDEQGLAGHHRQRRRRARGVVGALPLAVGFGGTLVVAALAFLPARRAPEPPAATPLVAVAPAPASPPVVAPAPPSRPVAAPASAAPPAATAPAAVANADVPAAPRPPVAPVASPALAQAPVAVAVAAPDTKALEERCRQAYGRRQYRDVVDRCGQALEAKPDAAGLAVLVAQAEFDRGRAAQALQWARKAAASDPTLADAYVLIGGAEQEAGRAQAAKAAYLKYLQLAPNGRHARDVRAVVARL